VIVEFRKSITTSAYSCVGH